MPSSRPAGAGAGPSPAAASSSSSSVTASYGLARDAATFFAALVPRRATAVQPAALVPLADTVFLVRGRPVRWLHTDGGGQAAERPAADKEAVHAHFRQQALANANNLAKLVMVQRFADGGYAVLDAEAAAAFWASAETSAGAGTLAVQRYVHARGGDRAAFRQVYDFPVGGSLAFSTTRMTEHLSPELREVQRGEMQPVRSFQESINGVLEELARRVVVQLEGALKCRVTHAALDFVFDDKHEQALLLWPHEVRTVELRRDGSVIVPPGGFPAPTERAAPAPPPPRAPPPPEPEPDWVLEKAARFEEEQRREAATQAEFGALVGRTVGSGERGHILLVDTDAWSVTAACRALAPAGFAVTVTDDGPKALALTRTATFVSDRPHAPCPPTAPAAHSPQILRHPPARPLSPPTSAGLPPAGARSALHLGH